MCSGAYAHLRYPAPVLAEASFYIPKWSPDILREVRSTLQKLSRTPEQIERRIANMEAAFEDACVEGYEPLIPVMTNDAKDRHILAAAVHCGAHGILTNNTRHFPPASLSGYDVEVQTTDEFLIRRYHLDPDLFIEILEDQAAQIGRTLKQLMTNLAVHAPKLNAYIGA